MRVLVPGHSHPLPPRLADDVAREKDEIFAQQAVHQVQDLLVTAQLEEEGVSVMGEVHVFGALSWWQRFDFFSDVVIDFFELGIIQDGAVDEKTSLFKFRLLSLRDGFHSLSFSLSFRLACFAQGRRGRF
jgi:hypothetical protein